MTIGGPDQKGSLPGLSVEEATELAARHGLRRVGTRPSLFAYAKELWRYRHLTWSMAKGDFVARHQNNYLGLLWSVLTPILLGIAYYLIFGVLIGTRGDLENFVSFLTIGLFTFIFLSSVLTGGSKALLGKLGLVRSLSFPRAMLPIMVVIAEVLATLPAFLILVLIALFSGERPTWSWLLFPVALAIVSIMGLGMAMLSARLVHDVRDMANLFPLIVRLLRYVSGVFFSIEASLARFSHVPVWVEVPLVYQPVAVALRMVREPLMGEYPLTWQTWAVGSGWAVAFVVAGFLVFWRAEGTYGRA